MKKKFKKDNRKPLTKVLEAGLIRIPGSKLEPIPEGAPLDIVDAFQLGAFQVMKRDQYEADQL